MAEALQRMGWSEADLMARPKGEPGKLELARELRAKKTMPLAEIAAVAHAPQHSLQHSLVDFSYS